MCYIDVETEQFHLYSPIDEKAMEKYAKLKTKTPQTGQGSIKGVAPNRGLPPLGKEGK